MNETKQTPGDRLRLLIKHLRTNQVQVAETIKANPKFISQIVTGKKPMTPNMAHRLLKHYGANPDWLLSGEGEMMKKPIQPHAETQVAEPMASYTLATRISYDDVPKLLETALLRIATLENKVQEMEVEIKKMKTTKGNGLG